MTQNILCDLETDILCMFIKSSFMDNFLYRLLYVDFYISTFIYRLGIKNSF